MFLKLLLKKKTLVREHLGKVVFAGLWGFFIHFLQCIVSQSNQKATLAVGGKSVKTNTILYPGMNLPKTVRLFVVINTQTDIQLHCYRRLHVFSQCPHSNAPKGESSHHAGLDVLAHALVVVMVVMVIVGSASRGVEGGDAVKVQHKIFSVADRGMALITWNSHCMKREKKLSRGEINR